MPSSSRAQHDFMAMASTAAGRARMRAGGGRVPPMKVAMEFRKADKGRHFKLIHVKKKDARK